MEGSVGSVRHIPGKRVNDLSRPHLNVTEGCRTTSTRVKSRLRKENTPKPQEKATIPRSEVDKETVSVDDCSGKTDKVRSKTDDVQDKHSDGFKVDLDLSPVDAGGESKKSEKRKQKAVANIKEDSNYADHNKNKKGKKKKKKSKRKVEITKSSEPKEPQSDEPSSAKKKTKTGCFDWLKSVIRRRQERQRAKEIEAIQARKSARSPLERLVEYERKRARGGEAFTVQLDDRPMKKPVLPPIRPRPGTARRDPDAKLRLAEERRLEKLEKKKQASKEHDRKRFECDERRSDMERGFKEKAFWTVRVKQGKAKKNRDGQDRRQLRAPSTLPPLRVTRRSRFADDDAQPNSSELVGTHTADSDRHVFDF